MHSNGDKSFQSTATLSLLSAGLAVLLILLLQIGAEAQSKLQRRNTSRAANFTIKNSFKKFRYTSVGASVSSLNYFGDLAPAPSMLSTDLDMTRPAFNFFLEHRQGPRYTWRAGFFYGTVIGADAKSSSPEKDQSFHRHRRNASFKNHIKELSITFVFDLIRHQSMYFKRPPFNAYAFSGIAIFHHNPKAKLPASDLHGNPLPDAGKWMALQPRGTEGQFAQLQPTDANYGIEPYKLIQPAVPLGVGVRIRANETINIFCEASVRYLFTDYIDDVSRNYVDLGVLDNPVAQALSYRGNEIGPNANPYSYVGRDGKNYVVEAGFGAEHPSNLRGDKSDNDFLFLFSIGSSVILKGKYTRAKSR
ncbi:MAG TPA: DUF6089 family protein [Chryseosolibacter sp.]